MDRRDHVAQLWSRVHGAASWQTTHPSNRISTFLLVGPPDPRALRTFIGEVAPRVRERVAARRAAEQEILS